MRSTCDGCAVDVAIAPCSQRSWLLLPFPFAFCVSHLLLLDVNYERFLIGDYIAALTVSRARRASTPSARSLAWATAGRRCSRLVKEFFGLVDLPRLQPIVYACVIVGNMGGMFLPGYYFDLYFPTRRASCCPSARPPSPAPSSCSSRTRSSHRCRRRSCNVHSVE